MPLEHDLAILQDLLERNNKPFDHPSYGVRKLYQIYLLILEDAIKVLSSLIGFLNK